MLCVSKVTTVRSSRESAGLKLSRRRRMMMMARPGDESETNSRGVCRRLHLQPPDHNTTLEEEKRTIHKKGISATR